MNTELVARVKQTEDAVQKRMEAAKCEAERIIETARAEAMEQYGRSFDTTHKQLIEGTFQAERDGAAAMDKEIQNGRLKITQTMERAQKNVEKALQFVIGELSAK